MRTTPPLTVARETTPVSLTALARRVEQTAATLAKTEAQTAQAREAHTAVLQALRAAIDREAA